MSPMMGGGLFMKASGRVFVVFQMRLPLTVM